jgi:hypothetical protein
VHSYVEEKLLVLISKLFEDKARSMFDSLFKEYTKPTVQSTVQSTAQPISNSSSGGDNLNIFQKEKDTHEFPVLQKSVLPTVLNSLSGGDSLNSFTEENDTFRFLMFQKPLDIIDTSKEENVYNTSNDVQVKVMSSQDSNTSKEEILSGNFAKSKQKWVEDSVVAKIQDSNSDFNSNLTNMGLISSHPTVTSITHQNLTDAPSVAYISPTKPDFDKSYEQSSPNSTATPNNSFNLIFDRLNSSTMENVQLLHTLSNTFTAPLESPVPTGELAKVLGLQFHSPLKFKCSATSRLNDLLRDKLDVRRYIKFVCCSIFSTCVI